MSSAAEAKTRAIQKAAIHIRIILSELGQPQGPTPLKTTLQLGSSSPQSDRRSRSDGT